MYKKIVVVLTACINPNGMIYTELQNRDERKKQYLNALYYYLTNTNFRIVFCENSGEDLIDLKRRISNPRVEMLSFQGNDYNKNLGKGYGEYRILQYAFQHSIFLKEATTIVKITGRLIVNNLVEVIRLHNNLFLHPRNFVYAEELKDHSEFDSRCVVASKEFFTDYFLASNNTINDSIGYFFEHYLFDTIKTLPENYIVSGFALPLAFSGVSGSTGDEYRCKGMSYGKKLALIRDFCQYKKRFFHHKNHLLYLRFSVVSFVVRIMKFMYK